MDKRKVECFNFLEKGLYKSECWANGGGDEGNVPKRGEGTEENSLYLR